MTAASNRGIARLDASILILIVALGLFSLAVWSNPTFPGLEDAPALDVTINVVAVLAGAAVAILAWTRWRDTGASVALFVALLAGTAHPLHQPAINVFRRVAAGELGLVVTPIVIAELVYVTRDVVGWSQALIVERLGLLLDADGLVVMEASVTRRALPLVRPAESARLRRRLPGGRSARDRSRCGRLVRHRLRRGERPAPDLGPNAAPC